MYGLPVGSGPGPNTRDLGPSPLTGSQLLHDLPYFTPSPPGIPGRAPTGSAGACSTRCSRTSHSGWDYLGRRPGPVIEDMSSTEGASYFIANPGASQPWTATWDLHGTTFNPRYAASLDLTNGVVYTAAFATPVRSYDADDRVR